jgi:hypothetical protein
MKPLPSNAVCVLCLAGLAVLQFGWLVYRRPWPVTVAYVERVIPLAVTLNFGAVAVLSALVMRSMGLQDWLHTYQRAYWPLAVALAVLVVAQVATWRGWSWWLRLVLHPGWIVLLRWPRPPRHPPREGSAFDDSDSVVDLSAWKNTWCS